MALKEHGFFWNSREKDRVYSADSFSEWAKTFFTTGVFANTNYVRAASGLTITVDAGYCNVEGKVAIFDAADTLTIATPHASLKRIDTVVIERNDVEREFYRKIVTGSPAANPVAKAPVRANGVYQLVLAQITVGAGVTSITQANIKDTRANANLCGYVAGVAKEISWEQITAQWDAYYEEFKASQFTDFDKWFNHMKGQLTIDAAGNLQTQIDGMSDEISLMDKEITGATLGFVGSLRIGQKTWVFQPRNRVFSVGDWVWIRFYDADEKETRVQGIAKVSGSAGRNGSLVPGEDPILNILEPGYVVFRNGTEERIDRIEEEIPDTHEWLAAKGIDPPGDIYDVVDLQDVMPSQSKNYSFNIKRYGNVVSIYCWFEYDSTVIETTKNFFRLAPKPNQESGSEYLKLRPFDYVCAKLYTNGDGGDGPLVWIGKDGVAKIYASPSRKVVYDKTYYFSITYVSRQEY